MIKTSLKALAAVAALVAVSPASAATYTYTMTNNDVLTIFTDTQSATFKGSTINATMKSADFSSFAGGATPSLMAVLSSLDGTRLIGGKWLTDNEDGANNGVHPQKLIINGNAVNLWAWWGPNKEGGDYLTTIKSYNAVPEPGMLGLMGASLAGLALARRRRKLAAA